MVTPFSRTSALGQRLCLLLSLFCVTMLSGLTPPALQPPASFSAKKPAGLSGKGQSNLPFSQRSSAERAALKIPGPAPSLEIMSYNIHHGADAGEVNTLKEMGAFIRRSGAGLVGLQEVDSLCRRSGEKDQMAELARLTGMHYAFARHFAYDGGAYGLGILSRYPLSDIRNDRITSYTKDGEKRSLALLSAKVSLPGGRAVRFATVHFALDQPTRMIQARECLRFLEGDLPVILTGDLNALPGTPEIQLLESRFAPACDTAAYTFPAGKAVKMIDYILVSKENLRKTKASRVWDEIVFSDHLPLGAEVSLR